MFLKRAFRPSSSALYVLITQESMEDVMLTVETAFTTVTNILKERASEPISQMRPSPVPANKILFVDEEKYGLCE